MKQRRFSVQLANRNLRYKRHAVIASVGLHLLFALIAALLLSGQRLLNKDSFEATFVTLNSARTDVEIRPTRRAVSTNTTLLTEPPMTRMPTQVSPMRQLPKNETQVVQQVPPLDIETDVPNLCLLYTSPSPRDRTRSRMPSSA